MSDGPRMPLVPALETLAAIRTDQVVVTTMGAAREWPRLSSHELDFHYVPSAMGHAPMLGLGIALVQPRRDVIVLNGDGCMLMGLGCLATIAASGATNYTLVVLENSLYEVTGGQRTAGVDAGVDFAAIARGAGFPSADVFADLNDWRRYAADALAQPGPRFILLRVADVGTEYELTPPGPIRQRVASFRAALAAR